MSKLPDDWYMPGGGYEQQFNAGVPHDQIRPPGAPAPTAGGNPRPVGSSVANFTGFTPRHRMRGFDFSREQNPNKSAKDAFAYLSQGAPPPPLEDKNALAVWFKTYIQPGMQAFGHNVTELEGDKFRFKNWQGDFWVDYGENAGSANGNLAWQADYASGGPSGQAYKQTQTAIMGVPRPQTQTPSYGAPSQAVLAPLQSPPGQPDMSDYYAYLQSLMEQR